MELLVLGCEGSAPSEAGATSGYLLTDGAHRIVLDLGFGTWLALREALAGDAPDAVLLTHRHRDHWADLPELSRALASGELDGPAPKLLAPAELLASLDPEQLAAFEVATLTEGEHQAGGFALEAKRCDHGPETYAALLTGQSGARLLASADTGSEVAWDGWAKGSVFLCEASYTSPREGSLSHLSGREAGQLACSVEAGELWLTHLQHGEDAGEVLAEAREAFAGPVLAVERGARYRVG